MSNLDPDQEFKGAGHSDYAARNFGHRGAAGAAFDQFDEAIDTLRDNAFSDSVDVNNAINTLSELGVHIDGLPEHPFVGDVGAPETLEEYYGD